MSRKEMEQFTTEQLETMKTGIGVTSHEAFLAQVILYRREELKSLPDYYYYEDPEDEYNGFSDELDRGYALCRIDD